jgi:hypothetical protein
MDLFQKNEIINASARENIDEKKQSSDENGQIMNSKS